MSGGGKNAPLLHLRLADGRIGWSPCWNVAILALGTTPGSTNGAAWYFEGPLAMASAMEDLLRYVIM